MTIDWGRLLATAFVVVLVLTLTKSYAWWVELPAALLAGLMTAALYDRLLHGERRGSGDPHRR